MLNRIIKTLLFPFKNERGEMSGETQIVLGTVIAFVPGLQSYGIAIALGGASRLLAEQPPRPARRAVQINTTSNVSKLPLVYGKARLGINRIFMEPSITNKYLWVVGTLCHGEVEAIDEIFFDDKLAADAAGTAQGDYSGLMTVYKHLGGDAQAADADLTAAITKWTSAHQGRGVAYIILKIEHNPDVFPGGLPNITCNVRGRKLYDPRDATTTYKTNPVLAVRDYLASTRYGGKIAAAGIDDVSIQTEANYADVLVDTPDRKLHFGAIYTAAVDSDIGKTVTGVTSGNTGKLKSFDNTAKEWIVAPTSSADMFSVTETVSVTSGTGTGTTSGASTTVQQTRFEINGVIDTSRTINENIDEMLLSCRGLPIYQGGKYSISIPRAVAPETLELNEDNIIGNWRFHLPGVKEKPNKIICTFINPDKNYQPEPFEWPPPGVTNQYLIDDNNFEVKKDIDLPHTTNRYMAERITNVLLEESRAKFFVSVTANESALQLKVGDVVPVTHSTPGWSAKPFRVLQMSLTQSGAVRLTLMEYDATAYDAISQNAYTPPGDVNLPDPTTVAAPTNLTLVSVNEYLINGDGTITPRLKVSWTPATDEFVIRYEIQYKLNTASVWQTAGYIPFGQTPEFYILPVVYNATYDVRARAKNIFGVQSSWLSGSHTEASKTTPPPDVDTFLVQRQPDGTREFSWTFSSPPFDHAGFKIRYKLGTGHAWEDMGSLHDGLLISAPFETNQLAAGTYTVGIKAIDTSGNESVNAKIIESTLGDPRIMGSLVNVDPRREGWPGTLTDCWKDNDGNLYATDTATWATSFPTWSAWLNWARSPKSPIIYQYSDIDLGAIVSFTPLVTVTVNGTLIIEERHKNAAVDAWSSWSAAGSLISARYVQIRVTVTNASTLADITQMYIIFSANIVDEYIEDLDTSTLTGANRIGVGDIRLPITKSYALIKTVQLTLQNVGAGWTWELIDKDTSVGPHVKIYNASNALADAVVDARIQGILS